jgi:MFS family permease
MKDGPSDLVPEQSAPLALRKNRNFQLLWTGQVLSDLGTQLGVLAYPLLIFAITGSPVIAGLVATVTSVVSFAVRLPAGALADRVNRRKTMIVCDCVRLTVLAGLAIGVLAEHTGTHYHRGGQAISWEIVLVVAIIDRVGDTIFSPSSTAALPKIVEGVQLEGAWAATEARQYAASLGGPALGGVLFSIGASIPFIGDAVSYGASVITSGLMRGDFDPETTEAPRKGLWREAFDGVRFIWHDALLRAVIFQSPLINFAFTGVVFTVILGLRHSGTSPTMIGLAQAGIGTGGLLGAIAAPRLQGRLTLSRMVLLVTGSGVVFTVVAALLMPSPLIAIPIAVPFFLAPAANAALFAAMLRETPEAMRGRINNALIQASTGLAALSPLVAGLLIAHASASWAMGSFAIAMAISTILALSLKGLRAAEAAAG